MKQYLDLLRDIKENGQPTSTRQNVDAVAVFGRQMRFDLQDGFPLLTTKKMFIRGIIHELLWFLQGSTNIKYLVDNDVHIWDEWPYRAYLQAQNRSIPDTHSQDWQKGIQKFTKRIKEDAIFARQYGELGPVYGYQWRHWPRPDGGHIDQIQRALDQIQHNPSSRRIIVSAWNVADIEEMAKAGLPPCHTLFQFHISNGKLSCQLYQRSADFFLGVPFNIASYALLTMMVAQVTGLQPGEFVHTLGNAHLFTNHFEQTELQLTRTPKKLPTMHLNPQIKSLFDFRIEDFTLEEYDPDPPIKAPIAV